MAENEIEILIKAVDEATATLKKIEKTVTDSGKNIEKQTKNTAKAFDKETGSLLVLGNAAGAVDSIFDSYQNLQLRLENASERVAGAQDRLAQAQYELNKTMQDGSATAEDIANAQRNVESASRSLTIAQNNQERANNAVVGTYIQIGMQSLNLVQSFPTLVSSIQNLTAAGTAFIATPLGMTIAAIGTAVVAAKLAIDDKTESVEKLREANEQWEESIRKVRDAQMALEQQPANEERLNAQKDILQKQVELQEIIAKSNEGKMGMDESTQIRVQQLEREIEVAKQKYDLEYRLKADLAEVEKQLDAQSYENRKAIADEEMKQFNIKLAERAKMIQSTQSEVSDFGNLSLTDLGFKWDKKWEEMGNVSEQQINDTIEKLGEIPTDIYTYHHIVTVRD